MYKMVKCIKKRTYRVTVLSVVLSCPPYKTVVSFLQWKTEGSCCFEVFTLHNSFILFLVQKHKMNYNESVENLMTFFLNVLVTDFLAPKVQRSLYIRTFSRTLHHIKEI